jgi:hypothetical protein
MTDQIDRDFRGLSALTATNQTKKQRRQGGTIGTAPRTYPPRRQLCAGSNGNDRTSTRGDTFGLEQTLGLDDDAAAQLHRSGRSHVAQHYPTAKIR